MFARCNRCDGLKYHVVIKEDHEKIQNMLSIERRPKVEKGVRKFERHIMSIQPGITILTQDLKQLGYQISFNLWISISVPEIKLYKPVYGLLYEVR